MSAFRRKALTLYRSVVLHTVDGNSFVGVLVGVYPDGYVLRHASALVPERTAIVGDLVVPTRNAAWFQHDVPDDLIPS